MKTARPLAKTYHVIVVVWGSEYLDLFLNTRFFRQVCRERHGTDNTIEINGMLNELGRQLGIEMPA